MADIFISYKKEDARRVEPIARALAQAGYEVWWDHNIPPGRTYRDVIGAGLATSACVMVIWSNLSASAQWVLDEADEGKKRGVLLPVLIDDVEPPYGFRQIEAASLVGWSGDPHDSEWANLLSSVAHFVGRPPGGPPKPFVTPSARPPAPRSARAEPVERRGSPLGPLLGVATIAAIAGGGYAAWNAGVLPGAPAARSQPAEDNAADEHDSALGEDAPAQNADDAPSERRDVAVPGDPLQTFFASGYVYCDAKLVADFWGGADIGETKTNIGWKILNGIGANVTEILQLSRNAGNACEWSDTGYSYADAERLAAIWGLAEPYQAKLRVASYLTNGERALVERALGR